MRARGLQARPTPGTRVRLTGIFLKNTGQHAGSEGLSHWLVVECACRACGDWSGPNAHPLVALNEPHGCQVDPSGYEDLKPEERPRWRHIAAWNLEIVGAPPRAADYP